MSSSSPEFCAASDDFEENSVGRYGIQPYQFEPRVETVPSVDEARSAQSSSREDEDMEFEDEERNPRTLAKFRLVGNEGMYVSGCHKIFRYQRFSSSQPLKITWQLREGINLLPPSCVNVHSSVCCAICSVISVSRARGRLI